MFWSFPLSLGGTTPNELELKIVFLMPHSMNKLDFISSFMVSNFNLFQKHIFDDAKILHRHI